MSSSGKRIIIIAGPNGAGKTTFAKEFLPNEADCPIFINADLIAQGISPFQPEAAALRAGRLMLQEIDNQVRLGESFAFETTLSGKSYVRRIVDWKHEGYYVKMFFLGLSSPDLAVSRVALRVEEGGHNIPEKIIRRRFSAGIENFTNMYSQLVNEWAWYDNSYIEPKLLDEGINND